MRKKTIISLFMILSTAICMHAQENTYKMVIEMDNGTKITVGPNDVKNITFNDEELVVTGLNLQEWMERAALRNEVYAMFEDISYRIYKLIGPLNEYLESSDWNVGDKLVEKLQALEAQMKDNEMNSNQLATALAALQTLLKDLEDQHDTDISDLQHQIDELKSRVEALETTGDIDPAVQAGLCPDGNHPHMIDLGLPSGRKWACCNIGASSPTEYGGYYAWGEIEEKTSYTSDNYSHYKGYNKYIGDIIGTNNISRTIYDVAYMKWGNSWCLPTSSEQFELFQNCSSEWVQVNGMYGRIFTSSNGNSIFMPAAGVWIDKLYALGEKGYYWSSSPVAYYSCGNLNFNSIDCGGDYDTSFEGYSVRPVYVENPTEYPELKLSSQSLSLENGDSGEVLVFSGSGSYAVSIDNENVAAVVLTDYRIIITGLSVGTATITVTDTKTEQTVTLALEVTVKYDYDALCPDDNHPHMINLGLDVKWACCNVGATKPEEFGGHYAWGEIEEKSSYTLDNYVHYDSESGEFDIEPYIEGTENDVATVEWGAPWRMPLMNEIDDLLYCTKKSITVNGVYGIKFTGPNGRSIFLPSAGYWSDNHYYSEGGVYWSGEGDGGSSAVSIYNDCIGDWDCYNGLSVRPVSK